MLLNLQNIKVTMLNAKKDNQVHCSLKLVFDHNLQEEIPFCLFVLKGYGFVVLTELCSKSTLVLQDLNQIKTHDYNIISMSPPTKRK